MNKGKIFWPTFLISPLLSYLIALRYNTSKSSIVIMILVCGFVGLLMSTSDDSHDLYRYLRMLNYSDSVSTVINKFISRQEVDLYAPLSISIIGSFTKNSHVLMCWFGLFFGYVYAKSVQKFSKCFNYISFGLLFCFANIYGINSIAGVRFATAIYVLFWGVISFLTTKEKKYLVIILLSAIVHFALTPGILVFIGYLILKNKPKIILGILAISFVASFSSIGNIILNVSSFLGDAGVSRAEIYSSDNTLYVHSIVENALGQVWFIRYKTDAAILFLYAIFCYIAIFRKNFIFDKKALELSKFLALWLSYRNIVVDVPDMGSRYTTAFIAFSIYLIYQFYIRNYRNKKASYVAIACMIGTSLCVMYAFRCIFYYVPFLDFVFPPIYGIINELI